MFNITLCLNFYKPQLGFASIEVFLCFRGQILFGNNAYIFFYFKHSFYLCKYPYLAITYVSDTQRKVYFKYINFPYLGTGKLNQIFVVVVCLLLKF